MTGKLFPAHAGLGTNHLNARRERRSMRILHRAAAL